MLTGLLLCPGCPSFGMRHDPYVVIPQLEVADLLQMVDESLLQKKSVVESQQLTVGFLVLEILCPPFLLLFTQFLWVYMKRHCSMLVKCYFESFISIAPTIIIDSNINFLIGNTMNIHYDNWQIESNTWQKRHKYVDKRFIRKLCWRYKSESEVRGAFVLRNFGQNQEKIWIRGLHIHICQMPKQVISTKKLGWRKKLFSLLKKL